MSDEANMPVFKARLNGNTLRAAWPGKRWHGKYKDIDEATSAAIDDGLQPPFIIDYVEEET